MNFYPAKILTLATARARIRGETVPMSVAKTFNLKTGDRLDWSSNVKNGELATIVTPVGK